MNTQHFLEQYEGPLKTTMGAAFPGERTIFRGYDLHHDLSDLDCTELLAFGITGRRFPKPMVKILSALHTCTSYPDPRLWNNRVVALAGSTRSTGCLAIAGGIAASEGTVFGFQTTFSIADFLIRAIEKINNGISLSEILKNELRQHKYIRGYGRPVATQLVDERIPFMMQLMKETGIVHGPYLKLALDIEKELIAINLPLRMNYAPIISSILLDFGFSLRQANMYTVMGFHTAMHPLFLEAIERPACATFPLRCSKIKYDGPEPKTWVSE
jgi:hypothetical protein